MKRVHIGLVPLLLGLGLLTTVVTTACSETPPEPMGSKTQASTAAAEDMEIVVPAFEQDGVLFGSDWVSVGDRARVLSSGSPAGVANAGDGAVTIGSDAEVGQIWANGSVDLRDRATAGDIQATGTITVGNDADTGVTESAEVESGPLTFETPDLSGTGEDVRLEPNQQRVLTPGAYGELSIKQGARVVLEQGTYSFTKMILDSGSKLEVTSVCEGVRVYVSEIELFRGEIIEAAGTPEGLGLVLGYSGTQTVHIEESFTGRIYAPFAELILASKSHVGRFFAQRLRVQSGAVVSLLADSEERPDVCFPEEEPLAAPPINSLGEMPPLTTADDVADFLPWFYRVRQGELELLAAAIDGATGNESVAQAVVSELNLMRQEGELGPSLMLTHLLASLDTTTGRNFLKNLLVSPLPPKPVLDDEVMADRSPFALELGIRRSAMFSLADLGGADVEASLLQVITTHSEQMMRSAAIRTYLRDKSDAEREAFRSEVLPEDVELIDRFETSDPNFAAKHAATVD